MKTLTAAMLTEINKLEGTEPLIVVGIEWVSGGVVYYADRDLPGINGKVLAIGDIEAVVVDNTSSSSLELTLDDIDGELKNIIDAVNIHKVNCSVYQFFGALTDTADKFEIFRGQISTPFTWNEKDRTISFSVVSEIESYEVGFSPEEGQLTFVNADFIGKPWPLCFGSVVHVPAQKVSQTLEGATLEEMCIADQLGAKKKENIAAAYNEQLFLMHFWMMVISGANLLSRSSEAILIDYVACIITERALIVDLNIILANLDKQKELVKFGIESAKVVVARLEASLDLFSALMHVNSVRKENLENEAKMAEFRYNTQKEAYNKAIAAANEAGKIMEEYVGTLDQACRENECSRDSIQINNGDLFPQGVQLTILIKDVKFTGMFSGNQFVFADGGTPTAKYVNVPIATWHEDDTCGQEDDETNGIATLYLANDPPENLENMYLLVKKRGGTEGWRHIIKVVRQEGAKVVYELVTIGGESSGGGDSTGQPSSQSLSDVVGKLVQTPFVATPFGVLPRDLFTDDWALSAWNRPESERVLAIIQGIPFGVNYHELEVIAKLVYLAEWDALGDDLILIPRDGNPRDVFTIVGEDIESIVEASPVILKSWLTTYQIPEEEIPESTLYTIETGASVRLNERDDVVYVANILPSTVHAVYSYRTLKSGLRVLSPVPSGYYTKYESHNLGTIDVTAFKFPIALPNIAGLNWEDDLYITLTSSVGPNVVDIIEHLIVTYTDGGTANAANFAAIKAKFVDGSDELYPANFALLERPNVLDEIARIAWEARCAVYRVGGEFFLQYLSEEPTENVTFSEADIDSEENIKVVYPQTEGLVTRLVATWHPNYLPLENGKKPQQLIYRHNIKLYGMQSEEIDFHIYNNKECVEKSATFWMIRKSNTWKRIQFKAFLKDLKLDLFDCIAFSFAKNYVANTDVKGVLLQATYDPNNHCILMEVELPIKAGEMSPYKWYWPAQEGEADPFPLPIEIEKGYAGGFGPGSGVTGTI